LPLEFRRHLMGHERLSRSVDLIEQLKEALPRQLRHGLTHRLAHQVALADEAPLGVVDQGINMVRPAQDRHVAGRLLDQGAQVRQLGPEDVARLSFAGGVGAL
jgi:hypothetical protein